MPSPILKAHAKRDRSKPQGIDRYVGARVLERRLLLGLTQQELAGLIGVTYQQAHKYEKGINRIAAGVLSRIAHALSVEVGYFFEGLDSKPIFEPTAQQRNLLALARDFLNIPSRRHQRAICDLSRVMANLNAEQDGDAGE